MAGKRQKAREPKQERSIEKKQRIIDTAIKLFSESGYDAVGPNEIARVSGVSVGTFYSYFEEKADLMIEIVRNSKKRRVDNVLEKAEKAVEKADTPRDVIYYLIMEIMRAPNLPSPLQRQSIAMRYTNSHVEEFHRQEEKHTFALIKHLLLLLGDAVRVSDRDLAAEMVLITIKESTRAYSIFKPKISRKKFVNELTDIISLYLFGGER